MKTKWTIEDRTHTHLADYGIFSTEGGGFPSTVASVPSFVLGNIGLKRAVLIKHVPELLSAAKDALESLRRLPDVDGAYRITCIQQIEAVLKSIEEKEIDETT